MTRIIDAGIVTDQMREQYATEGYFILEGLLTREQLDVLRSGAQHAIRHGRRADGGHGR